MKRVIQNRQVKIHAVTPDQFVIPVKRATEIIENAVERIALDIEDSASVIALCHPPFNRTCVDGQAGVETGLNVDAAVKTTADYLFVKLDGSDGNDNGSRTNTESFDVDHKVAHYSSPLECWWNIQRVCPLFRLGVDSNGIMTESYVI